MLDRELESVTSSDWTDDASGQQLDRLLAEKSASLGSQPLLEGVSRSNQAVSAASDTSLLAACSEHVLRLETDQLDASLDVLLSNLESRSEAICASRHG